MAQFDFQQFKSRFGQGSRTGRQRLQEAAQRRLTGRANALTRGKGKKIGLRNMPTKESIQERIQANRDRIKSGAGPNPEDMDPNDIQGQNRQAAQQKRQRIQETVQAFKRKKPEVVPQPKEIPNPRR